MVTKIGARRILPLDLAASISQQVLSFGITSGTVLCLPTTFLALSWSGHSVFSCAVCRELRKLVLVSRVLVLVVIAWSLSFPWGIDVWQSLKSPSVASSNSQIFTTALGLWIDFLSTTGDDQ